MLPGRKRVPHPKGVCIRIFKRADETAPWQKIIPANLTGFSKGCRSNRESGLGRFDIQLTPQVRGIPGFLFEFKHTNDPHASLDALADTALHQIEDRKYDTELQSVGIDSIIKIGIAFRGKTASVKCQ